MLISRGPRYLLLHQIIVRFLFAGNNSNFMVLLWRYKFINILTGLNIEEHHMVRICKKSNYPCSNGQDSSGVSSDDSQAEPTI